MSLVVVGALGPQVGSAVQGLPVSAQFWGPRFSEPEIVQSMIDYQAHFPDYHSAAPADPMAPAPGAAPKLAPTVVPHDDPTNDPVLGEQAVRKALTR
ncbi:hypothetical protein LWP59_14395 [Amycolatopsis acidiphila]|uniref:Uncharacterized protein n=1 Tax=Amycolatopsis acidiphila TaxID=715473 RepID=A0A558AKG1_9PSEU|nr:hypothetical protein [Amycolatopsis acidiphila]TVT24757.1 hypothetical protein FNH06_05095 [Amycolatopsis acidiphila]UIJ62726.1 hypothetical protein LWP59_14395 [Amycolatopsis acidiphila]GHG63824.1 hypothetical protein GCM10017788_20030 [Amycolatopsis acidiphila]